MAVQVTEQKREAKPMKRLRVLEEVAKAVLFFRFNASCTSGAEVPVHGGLSQI